MGWPRYFKSSHPVANVFHKGVCQMITLNRLGHRDEPFHLNIDMIVTVESTPDTVITLATGAKVVVAETPEEVAAAVRGYRADVLGDALKRRGSSHAAGGGSHAPGATHIPGGSHPPPVPLSHRGETPRLTAVEDPAD